MRELSVSSPSTLQHLQWPSSWTVQQDERNKLDLEKRIASQQADGQPARHWRFRSPSYDDSLEPDLCAEKLPADVARAAMRHCMTLRKPEGLLKSAWHHIEFAMNYNVTELDDDLRNQYFGDVRALLTRLSSTDAALKPPEDVSPLLHRQSLTLLTYLPLFHKRALHRPITTQDCRYIQSSLGEILKLPRVEHSQHQLLRDEEVLVLYASARAGKPELLLFPTSPREESSTQAKNHDGYFYRDRDPSKIPIQTKLESVDRRYEDSISVLCVEAMAHRWLARSGIAHNEISSHPLFPATNAMIELARQETNGYFDDQTQHALNLATSSVAARLRFANQQSNAA